MYNFLCDNKSLYFMGFMQFRLFQYKLLLEDLITQSVNSYIIEKEYIDFISLLEQYVKSNPSNIDVCHLIYLDSNAYLLDQNNEKIALNKDISGVKYISDISFSDNDYILNTLLDLLPEKLYIHTKNNYIDEFINSLLLVFNKNAIVVYDEITENI